MADINYVLLTGASTKTAQLRRKASDQTKAEFSFQVDRPFDKPDGEPVSDLFLIDAWGDLAKWCGDNVEPGSRLLIIGTLNKESFKTRGGGKEHITVVKAKYVIPLDGPGPAADLDIESIKPDDWELSNIIGQLGDFVDYLDEMETSPTEG